MAPSPRSSQRKSWPYSLTQLTREALYPPAAFDTETEQLFQSDHAKRFLAHRRVTILAAMFLWCVFAYWDYWHYRTQPEIFTIEVFKGVSLIRFIGAVVIASTIYVFWTRPMNNERLASLLLLSNGAIACGALIAMLMIAPSPINYQYFFPGLMLAVSVCSGLLYIFAYRVIALGGAVLLALGLGHIVFPAIDNAFIGPALFFCFSFWFFGSCLAVRFETTERERFSRELALENQRVELEKAKGELERASEQMQRAKDDAEKAYERYRDVQEAARIQLEQRTREAEEGDRAKARFIARASHDLRQPMSALQNFLEVARHWHAKGDTAQVGTMLDRMSASISTLSETFSRILDIAKYESGEYKPEVQPVDLQSLLSDIESQLGGLAYGKGIELTIRNLKRPPFHTISDYEMLWRILSNLVGNAIKFTSPYARPGGGRVLVGATRIRDRFRIDIYDTGVGVPKAELEAIWEPFYQIRTPERNRGRGSGLGLAIVRAACASLGHDIEVQSIEGRGSRFSLWLPVGEEPALDVRDLYERTPGDRLKNAFVLLLEDDDDARESQEALLKTWGVEYVSGVTSSDVLATASRYKREPDVILTDLSLSPNETGVDAVVVIRSCYGRPIPAVIVTGAITRPLQSLASVEQVKLLHKPVNPGRLKKVLNDLLV